MIKNSCSRDFWTFFMFTPTIHQPRGHQNHSHLLKNDLCTFLYHSGASRSSINILHGMGLTSALRSYDAIRTEIRLSLKQQIEAECLEDIFLWWWDNFSKIFWRSYPSEQRELYIDCLWTVTAKKKYTGTKKITLNKGKISALPETIGTDFMIEDLIKDFLHMQNKKDEITYENSISQFITCNPLRLERKDENGENSVKFARLFKNQQKPLLQHESIVDKNVGSNVDLNFLLENEKKRSANKFILRLLDINLFNRSLKVNYSLFIFIFVNDYFIMNCH